MKHAMEMKREVSILIPYKDQGGKILVYLQKRAKDATRLPDYFGFFGGGIEENENSEEALVREIQEELTYALDSYEFLGRYDFPRSILHAFYLEVDDNFENEIKIEEGEYGKYFSAEEVRNEQKLIETDKIVLEDLFKKFL